MKITYGSWPMHKQVFATFLLLCPWPWPDDLYIRTWSVFPGVTPDVQIWTSYMRAFGSYRLWHTYKHTDRETDRQTRLKLYTTRYTPLRGWSIKSNCYSTAAHPFSLPSAFISITTAVRIGLFSKFFHCWKVCLWIYFDTYTCSV